MTGMNPGKHGFFDFIKLGKITYDSPIRHRTKDAYGLVHSGLYARKTLWDMLSRAGYRVSVLMMPMTYPAWSINGYMVAGFPAPNFKNPDTFPKAWSSQIGPLFDISAISINNEDRLLEECKKLAEKEGQILLDQLKRQECHIYAVVFSSTDFVQHHLWKYLGDKSSPYHSAIPDIYIKIDEIIGQVLRLVDKEKTSVVVLSDHGFAGRPKKCFHTNAWLTKNGYLLLKDEKGSQKIARRMIDAILNPLRYRKAALRTLLMGYIHYLPKTIQTKLANTYHKIDRFDWLKTKAFRYKVGQIEGIAINLQGRMPHGSVKQEEYEDLRSKIINELKEVVDEGTGEKVICEIYRREEIYNGEYIESVPDIVFIPNSNFIGGLDVDGQLIGPVDENVLSELSGFHAQDGILIFAGPKFRKGLTIDTANIVDLFPTILFDLELDIPNYADGRVLQDAFEHQFQSIPADYMDMKQYSGDDESALSDREEELMRKVLKGLGYL